MTAHHYSPSQDFEQLSDSIEVLSFIDEPATNTNYETLHVIMTLKTEHADQDN